MKTRVKTAKKTRLKMISTLMLRMALPLVVAEVEVAWWWVCVLGAEEDRSVEECCKEQRINKKVNKALLTFRVRDAPVVGINGAGASHRWHLYFGV